MQKTFVVVEQNINTDDGLEHPVIWAQSFRTAYDARAEVEQNRAEFYRDLAQDQTLDAPDPLTWDEVKTTDGAVCLHSYDEAFDTFYVIREVTLSC